MSEEKLSQYGYTETLQGEFGEVQQDDKLYQKLMDLFDEFREDINTKWIRAKWEMNRRIFLAQGLGIPLAQELTPDSFGPLNMQRGGERKPMTSTPILYSTYENLCSDALEMVPEAVFLGRSMDDGQLANDMTAIFRSVLSRRHFRKFYSDWVKTRNKYGVAIIETMWDDTLDGGEGDVDFQVWQPDDIYVDPLCEDFQSGRAVFKVTNHHPSWYKEHYPDKIQYMLEAASALGDDDDRFAASHKSQVIPLVEAWCRRWDAKKERYTVHMYKLAGGAVLENSELDKGSSNGMYTHGQYPFVLSCYERIPGTPWGLGPLDYLTPVQQYISDIDDYILQNTKASAKPRVYVTQASGLDAEKIADGDNEVFVVNGGDLDCVKWETGQPLNPVAMQMYFSKIDTLKTESGQNAASRGEVPGSVTAASAIGMLQSAGHKRANLAQYGINTDFEAVVRQIVSCMMQFYTKQRVFRQRGPLVETDAVYTFDPAAYKENGHEWLYDLEVKVQRESTFQTAYLNQTILSFVQMGAMDVGDAMMLLDIPNKDAVTLAVRKTSNMKQTLQALMNRVRELEGQQAAAQAENQELMQAAEETPPEVGAVEMPDMGTNPMFAQATTA